MNKRARAIRTIAIAAAALAIGLVGCSTIPDHGAAASGVACLNVRSAVTNLEALRAWCLDHHDAAGAAGWVTGIENALRTDASASTATSSRIRDAASRLDAQVQLLSGTGGEAAVAQLPGVITDVLDELKPARAEMCA
ncbi:hypothetical protein [Leifsonia sp. 21MFCrub1.1]|uniref:hypothetical protein n=1 Tax=Leifsonia sp. 21MFCrub1.1 TaxID=1798223 RepID=UPI000892A11F|nr:hypothetical protein [Leifsonia sp. 21MFCrub1.1]SEA76084.1 hypothetical protein SAMN04515680_1450 [Leifsonia sp. 21MFCrub1.1]